MLEKPVFKVHFVRHLDQSAYVLRLDRHGLKFEPGQYVNLGLRGSLAMREYSIYSGASEDFLEVLVREIPGGLVSAALALCEPGGELALEGPYGMFVTDPLQRGSARYLFIGSGTGISPFHCLVASYPRIDYLLLHGTRTADERFDAEAFDARRFIRCISRSPGHLGTASRDYGGRVTGWLRENRVDPASLCYLCGNSDMIYEAFSILKEQGVPRDHLFAEIYF